jgi:uncharacterized protein YegP (UPF0339 family)
MAHAPSRTDVYAALRVGLFRERGVGSGSFSASHYRGEEALEKTAKFILYQDFDGRYRWRLRSDMGATIASSESGHHEKTWCAQEMEHWKREYPDVPVRDATVPSLKKRLHSHQLVSQSS